MTTINVRSHVVRVLAAAGTTTTAVALLASAALGSAAPSSGGAITAAPLAMASYTVPAAPAGDLRGSWCPFGTHHGKGSGCRGGQGGGYVAGIVTGAIGDSLKDGVRSIGRGAVTVVEDCQKSGVCEE